MVELVVPMNDAEEALKKEGEDNPASRQSSGLAIDLLSVTDLLRASKLQDKMKKTTKPGDSRSNQQNPFKGTSSGNKPLNKGQGNRGKPMKLNQGGGKRGK